MNLKIDQISEFTDLLFADIHEKVQSNVQWHIWNTLFHNTIFPHIVRHINNQIEFNH